jgi:N-methylhydantoinase B
VQIERFEEETDSAGAGEFRGGNGHLYRVKHLVPSQRATVFGSGTKPHAVPSGLFGGHSPEVSRLTIERADGERQEIPLNSFFSVGAGDVIELRQMGGPGLGDPIRRDPQAVVRDVRDGYVSAQKARDVYGVALDEAGGVDEAETARLREAKAE